MKLLKVHGEVLDAGWARRASIKYLGICQRNKRHGLDDPHLPDARHVRTLPKFRKLLKYRVV